MESVKFYETAPNLNSDPQGLQEYEQRPFPVRCAICGTIDYALEKTLREKGWSLSRKGEYCPQH